MRSEALRKSGASVICRRSRAPRDRSIIAGDRSLAASRCVSVSLSVRFAPRDRAFRALPSSSSSSSRAHVRCHRSARDTNTHLRAFTSVAPTRRSRRSVKGVPGDQAERVVLFAKLALRDVTWPTSWETTSNPSFLYVYLTASCVMFRRRARLRDLCDINASWFSGRFEEVFFISMITWENA